MLGGGFEAAERADPVQGFELFERQHVYPLDSRSHSFFFSIIDIANNLFCD